MYVCIDFREQGTETQRPSDVLRNSAAEPEWQTGSIWVKAFARVSSTSNNRRIWIQAKRSHSRMVKGAFENRSSKVKTHTHTHTHTHTRPLTEIDLGGMEISRMSNIDGVLAIPSEVLRASSSMKCIISFNPHNNPGWNEV